MGIIHIAMHYTAVSLCFSACLRLRQCVRMSAPKSKTPINYIDDRYGRADGGRFLVSEVEAEQ